MSEYKIHFFENGIGLAYRKAEHTKVAYCGIMLDMGSRDENEKQIGLAHFWEHLAFKGTKKRNYLQIINRLESLGGEINAYTTKEKICFHASILDIHFSKAIEILIDITFNSIFPSEEVEKEKNIILEELKMYEDSPDEAIQDEFDSIMFPNHAIGENILGKKETLSTFSREDLLDFINTNFSTDRCVVSVVTSLDFEKVLKIVEKLMLLIPQKKNTLERFAPSNYVVRHQKKVKNIQQAHIVLGKPTIGLLHEERLTVFMLSQYLGGYSMNSKLNMQLREKYALVYSIEANFTPYTDIGSFSIYLGCDGKKISKSLKIIDKELAKLYDEPMKKTELSRLKNQLKGQLAIAEESMMGYMLMMAKSILDFGKVELLEEIFEKIDLITVDDMFSMSKDICDREKYSELIYLPLA